MEDKTQRRHGLRIKFILVTVAVALLISGTNVLVGSRIYQRTIILRYNTMAYQVADIVEGYFTQEEMETYGKLSLAYHRGEIPREQIDQIINGDRYKLLQRQVDRLCESMDANGVYICIFDTDEMMNDYSEQAFEARTWKPLCYIMNSSTDPDLVRTLGDCDRVAPDLIDDIHTMSTTGKRVDNYFLADGIFGYNTTAFEPVTKDGETIGVIAVEIPMLTLEHDTREFILLLSIVTTIVLTIILLVVIHMLNYTLIEPIRVLAREATGFVKSNTTISKDLEHIRTNDEIQDLAEDILQLERDVNEYIDHIRAVTTEKERISAELNVATQIQADMLPSIFPAFQDRTSFDIYATMDPAKEVGGDFYDFFLVDDDHLALVIADVSGKGVPAALFMVIAKTLIKNHATLGGSPSEVLSFTNEQLCEGNKADLFVTVWMAIIELSTGKGVAANAGHEHPVLCRSGGEYELCVYSHSPAVAAMNGMKFREHTFELHPGDRLFVYTDGVPEAVNPQNVFYGTDRLLTVLNKNKDASPGDLLKNIREDIEVFADGASQFDDITMLAFYYYGNKDEV